MTVTVDEAGKVEVGVRVTVRLSAETAIVLPKTAPFAYKAKVFPPIVPGFSDLEKVTTAVAFKPIFVAPLTGETESTEGTAVSVPPVVVNELEKVLEDGGGVFTVASDSNCVTTTCMLAAAGSGESGVKVTTGPATA